MLERLSLALIGAAIGWFLSWHRYRVAENANLISDHIKDIEAFSEELLGHWTTSYTDDAKQEQKLAIAKIKALHVSLNAFYGYGEERLGRERYRSYQVLMLRLFNVGLGGEFETIGRDYCADTAIDTQEIVGELVQMLRIARREQYGFSAMLRSVVAWRMPKVARN